MYRACCHVRDVAVLSLLCANRDLRLRQQRSESEAPLRYKPGEIYTAEILIHTVGLNLYY